MISGDTLFWTFSTLLQSLAAIIAALIAGYTIVIMISDKQEQKHNTLTSFYEQFRTLRHKRLKHIFLLLSMCIALDTILILSTNNKYNVITNTAVIAIIAAYTNVYVIIISLKSILSLVNTKEDKIAAQQRINNITLKLGIKNVEIRTIFFTDKRNMLLEIIKAIKGKLIRENIIYDDYDHNKIIYKLYNDENITEDDYYNYTVIDEINNMIDISNQPVVDESIMILLDNVYDVINRAKNFLKTGKNISTIWINPEDQIIESQQVKVYPDMEMWIKEPFIEEYYLEYEVIISERVLSDISPDIRLILAPALRGYPRVAIICPWQINSNYPGHREGHIVLVDPRIKASGVQDGVYDQHVRLDQKPVSRIEQELNSFTATLLVTERELTFRADFFEDKGLWLTVSKVEFEKWNYPFRNPQFIGIFSPNCTLEVKIKNAIQMAL